MKVIFLDIDGVMNCQKEMLAMLEQDPKARSRADLPSPTKCKLLKQLVDETGAEIVLSSSWRLSLQAIQNIIDTFRPYGLRLDGFTCEGVLRSVFNGTEYKNIKPKYTHHCYEGICIDDRGAEIAYWLLKHPEVTNFVILDDESSDIIEWLPDNLVKTDLLDGLTEEKVLEGIKVLNGGSYGS
jgi:hypothetical protein